MPATWDNYPLNYRPATEADIFAAFEAATHSVFFVPNPKHTFGPEMSLHHWSDAFNDIWGPYFDLTGMYEWLHDYYHLDCDIDAWYTFVNKPKQKTIRDVCRFAVEHNVRILDPTPLRIAGQTCEEAGVFLAFRLAMTKPMHEPYQFRPSDTINSIARGNPDEFSKALFKINPQLASRLRISYSKLNALAGTLWMLTLSGGLLSLFCWFLGFSLISWVNWLILFTVISVVLRISSYLPPTRVEIEGLKTMADLSREIVRYQRGTQPA